MSKLTASLLCALIGVICFGVLHAKAYTTGVERIHNLDKAIAILRESTLESRAQPNQRLVRAFHIENSFATTSSKVQRSFVVTVKELLLTDDNEFRSWSQTAISALEGRISYIGHKDVIPLVETVQVFVLRACLNKFFPESPSPEEKEAILITQYINSRWIGSKNPYIQVSPTQVRSQRALESAFKEVFELEDIEPADF